VPESQLTCAPFHLDSDGVLRARLLDAQPWLEHGFGTRLARDWPNAPLLLKQIHSDRVVEAGAGAPREEADAVITNLPGVWLPVRTADCLPILLADPVHHAVAAVHAGWRGVVSRIAAKTVASLVSRYGSRPAGLLAAIGPGIGVCCFEVGPEVAEQFRFGHLDALREPQKTVPRTPKDLREKTHIDLAAAVVKQLTDAGISPERIAQARLCTRCDAALFESWRRDRESAGRMVSAIRVQ
jgi:YfiH family protein